MAKYKVQKQPDGTWTVSAQLQGQKALVTVASETGLKQDEVHGAAATLARRIQAHRKGRQLKLRLPDEST